MLENRHRSARKGFEALGLLSVMALLAFLCFPVFASADSGEIQYEEVTPTVTGEKNPPKSHHEPTAQPSKVTGGAEAPGGNNSNSESTPVEPSTGGQGSETVNASGDDKGQGNRAHDTAGNQKHAGQDQSSPQTSAPTHKADDGGGSSPLVPILIAIAALAAISVGVVVMRAKRQQRGPQASVSPKAS